MDSIDWNIVERLQEGIPIAERPFQRISKELKIPEDEILKRLKKLKREGLIRRFGAVINYKKLGYTGTLVATKVPEDKIEEIAEKINKYKGVTHNYQRNFEYNLWFTLIEKSQRDLEKRLKQIEQEIKPEKMISLPVTRKFKIGHIQKWIT